MDNHEPTISELIDACRADQDDLAEPEMKPLRDALASDGETRRAFERSQQWDRKVRNVFQESEVPDHLQDQLLDQLAGCPDVTTPERKVVSPSGSSREFLVRLSAAAIAASLLAIWVLQPWQDASLRFTSEQQLLEQSVRWYQAVDPNRWQALTEQVLSEATPPTRELHQPVQRWQTVAAENPPVIGYALTNTDDLPAVLLVLPASAVTVERVHPPRTPTLSTQGLNLATWTSGDWTYVVIISGERDRYNAFIRAGGDVARLTRALQRAIRT